jgi:hypothetical protein
VAKQLLGTPTAKPPIAAAQLTEFTLRGESVVLEQAGRRASSSLSCGARQQILFPRHALEEHASCHAIRLATPRARWIISRERRRVNSGER